MDYNFKTKPFKHQLDALARSAGKRNFAYFMEMGCVDENTEFLTQRGWVRFGDFDLETWERPLLVAQALPTNDVIRWGFEFVEPQAYIKKLESDWYEAHGIRSPYTESGYQTCFRMTSDHTLPITYDWTVKSGQGPKKRGSISPKNVDVFDAKSSWLHQVFNKDPKRNPKYAVESNLRLGYINRCTEGLKGFNSDYYVPPEDLVSLSEWELRFMVAVMADATYPNKTNNKVDFYFTKERKAERLKFLAARAGIPLAYEKRIRNKEIVHVFHAIAPARYKIYTEEWFRVPARMLRIIVDEVFFWDGYAGMSDAQFYTVHKESADFIQYALMALGWSARLSYSNKLYTVSAGYNKCYHKRYIPECTTGIERKLGEWSPIACKSSVIKECVHLPVEARYAYCFRVPSGYLILRRDNRIFISGNSGKTKVMLDNIGVLHQKGQITGALVLAPKGVYRNWSAKEIPTHLPDEINREVLVWDAAASQGRKDKLLKQIRDWDGKTLQFLVFNIESLISEKGRKLIVDFIRKHDGNVFALVDESTCIKNHKAKRTKAAIEIGQKCKARRIATGSPVTNSPLDLYSQCAFLDKSLLGCGSYYAFKNTYANVERIQNRQGQHYEKIISYKNLDYLSSLLDKFSYRVTKKECLDLPEKIYMTRDVELTPEQEKVYREMYDYQFSLLQQGDEFQEMSAQVILTKLLRLHQVLCGTFTSDDGTITRLPNNRVEALREVLDEASGKVIIWATYLADIEDISEMLKKEYGEDSFVTYYGATSSEDRTKAINLFQDESSPVRFFLGNVQTAGRGITLTAASTVVYYSNNFSLELRQQSEDRAHRLGQKNNVTYIDLVVRGSLDEKIIKSLIEKRNIANEILKDDLDDWISLRRE